MNRLKRLTFEDFARAFPVAYPATLPNQEEAFRIMAREHSLVLELPTGTGKTAVGYTFLKALQMAGAEGPLYYLVPTKTLVEQVQQLHPEMYTILGRHEFPCIWPNLPAEELPRADEIPCALLVASGRCRHKVDPATGETLDPGLRKCPYYEQRYQAKKGQLIVTTMAYYLFTHWLNRGMRDAPAGLVIDEAHQFAKVVRSTLSYEITDWHLGRAVELLHQIEAREAVILDRFLDTMVRIVRAKPANTPTLLETAEIKELLDLLKGIDSRALDLQIGEAMRSGKVDPIGQREVLHGLETVARSIPRYLNSFTYALTTPDRDPLNYTFGYYTKERRERERVRYRLTVKAYAVAPIIRSILSPRTLAYSATIGDPEVFGWESGIALPHYTLPSPFPSERTRVFLPTDTPNLAVKQRDERYPRRKKNRDRREPTKVLRRIAKACASFARADIRALVVVVSEAERRKFLFLAEEERVRAISYGNGVPAKEAARKFKDGEGDVLVGTAAQYGEGVDLPKQLAPVIFFLRPAYPHPHDPGTVFEERRWRSRRWALWKWRVMTEALQVRGRNIRSAHDLGVTFFISQQFGRFLYGALPDWLKDSYRSNLTFDGAVKEAKRLLVEKK